MCNEGLPTEYYPKYPNCDVKFPKLYKTLDNKENIRLLLRVNSITGSMLSMSVKSQ